MDVNPSHFQFLRNFLGPAGARLLEIEYGALLLRLYHLHLPGKGYDHRGTPRPGVRGLYLPSRLSFGEHEYQSCQE